MTYQPPRRYRALARHSDIPAGVSVYDVNASSRVEAGLFIARAVAVALDALVFPDGADVIDMKEGGLNGRSRRPDTPEQNRHGGSDIAVAVRAELASALRVQKARELVLILFD